MNVEKIVNLTSREIALKNKKNKRIKITILLLLTVPINIFVAANGWYSSEFIYTIISGISALCAFIGFCIIGMTLTGTFDNKDIVIRIAGKVIDNEDIHNINKMTLLEKIKTFNIIGIIMRILAVPAVLGVFILLFDDPMNLFNIFENVSSAKTIAGIMLTIIINIIFVSFSKFNFSKSLITITIIIECIFTWYFFYYMLYLA